MNEKLNLIIQEYILLCKKQLNLKDYQFLQRIYQNGVDKYFNQIYRYNLIGNEYVLDAGCGFGQWTIALSKYNDLIYAVDSSSLRIKFLSNLFFRLNIKNVNLSSNFFMNLSYENEFFDLIFSYSVIPFVSWKEVLKFFYDLLKPGGKLFINANDIGWYNLLWEKEHNKSSVYDPRQIVAQSYQKTIQYQENNYWNPIDGGSIIILPEELILWMYELGYKDIILYPSDALLEQVNSEFLPYCYKGNRAVYEVFATK